MTSSLNNRLFSEWGLGGELSVGLIGWTGDRWSMGGSLFGGGEAFDLDAKAREVRSWSLGLRFCVAYH